MKPYQKAFIEMAIENQALRFGEFTLKSGRVSPYFFNMGSLNTGHVLKALGESYASAIEQQNIRFDVLFGPAYKGIPLVCTTTLAFSSLYQKNIPFCFNRKEAKTHGEQGNIVGAPLQGSVLIIDDVITAGTAIRESFDIISKAGATVSGVMVALDRQEKGQGQLSAIQEIEALYHVPVNTIVTFNDIITYIKDHASFSSHFPAMMAYRAQYGV